MDPIIRRLLNLSNEDIEAVKSINEGESCSQTLVELQAQYLNKGYLTAKQVRYAGNVFKQTFEDEFKINGTVVTNTETKKEKKQLGSF